MSGRTMLVLGLVVWVVGMPLAHGVVPWAISLLATRYGWIDGRPGMWNLLGLVPVLVGIALLIWTFVTGLRNVHRMPERVEVFVSPYLLTSGPYAFTRKRLPAALCVPKESFRQITAWRNARSLALLVGSIPSTSRKVHRRSR
jgi:hypothetical protein